MKLSKEELNAKFTPGPWVIRVNSYHPGQRTIEEKNSPDGHFVIAVVDAGDEREKANARLIACAPELLEALKRAEAHLSFLAITMPDNLAAKQVCNEVSKQAIDAIAKATGRK